jgi:hypothetical protein
MPEHRYKETRSSTPPTRTTSMPRKAKPQVTAALSGAGQHYALELDIPGVGADAREVTLDWDLPAAAYVDSDEVETRSGWPACVRTAHFTGASDVEAPEYASEAHRVKLRWTLAACDALTLSLPVHLRAPTPDASQPLGGRRRVALDAFELRVDGRARGRPAAAAPLLADAALPPGGPVAAWGVALVTLAVLFWEARRVARCLRKRGRAKRS